MTELIKVNSSWSKNFLICITSLRPESDIIRLPADYLFLYGDFNVIQKKKHNLKVRPVDRIFKGIVI